MTTTNNDNRVDLEYEHFKQDIQDIKQSLRGVMETLQRLAVLEERFTMVSNAISSTQHKMDMLDERQRKLENEHIYAKASANTVAVTAKVAWALGGGVVMAVITKALQVFL
jgi:archaellum component FlaC